MITTEEREKFRMELIAKGVALVYGQGRGSGDSADTFECHALAKADRVEEYTSLVGRSTIRHHRLYKGDAVVREGTYYELAFRPDDLPDFMTSEESNLYYVVEVDEALGKRLNKLFEQVCDNYEWWHFNDDGSFGEFFWRLEDNKAAVIGGYYFLETHSKGDDDPLNIEKEALE